MDAVAVITDIHGNLPALEAALARIDDLGLTRIYCGGDLVGYGPHPNEVVALIAERDIPTIYGNYDYAIARDLEDCGCAYVTVADRELGQQSVAWTLTHTDQASKEFMRALPFDLRMEVGGIPVHLVHGSPRKVNEYLFEESRPGYSSDSPKMKRPTSSCSATPTSRGSATTATCRLSTAARLVSRRTGIHGPRSQSCDQTAAVWRR